MIALQVVLLSVSGASPSHRMWAELSSACSRGVCFRHSNSSAAVSNTTDCKGRLLAYEYGLQLQPLRGPMPEVFDALELESCGVTPPPAV